ncbi:MAG: 7-carboxy-7-deazaguanine synthase QueE [Flavobacteriales bacterium]|nr:7-carboxy-7-deazaguanine synthase QueE [Flavobacteriales bacterium]
MALTKEQKELLERGEMLPIMEEFYTVQGEGGNTGKPAYFVRIGGCDVGCHWCDVKESWNPDLHPVKSVDEVVKNAIKYPAKAVVITGGEPSMYNLEYLTEQFVNAGMQLFVETSGAYHLTGIWHWICLSPKKNAPPKEDVYNKAQELKIIVHDKNDLKWAEEHAEKVNTECRLFLQPEWSKREEIMPIIVDYVMNNPKWNISLQTHKYLHIP